MDLTFWQATSLLEGSETTQINYEYECATETDRALYDSLTAGK